jgi:hypothetical protein
MAAGDRLLDADGNIVLDADGYAVLSEGTNDDCCCGNDPVIIPGCVGGWDGSKRKYIYQDKATIAFSITNIDMSSGGYGTQSPTVSGVEVNLSGDTQYFPLTLSYAGDPVVLYSVELGWGSFADTVTGADDNHADMNWRGNTWYMTVRFYQRNEDGTPGALFQQATAYDDTSSNPIVTGVNSGTADDDYYFESAPGWSQSVEWSAYDGTTSEWKSGSASASFTDCWCNFGSSIHIVAALRTRGKYDATTYPYVLENHYAKQARIDSQRTVIVDLTLKEDETPSNTSASGLNGTYVLDPIIPPAGFGWNWDWPHVVTNFANYDILDHDTYPPYGDYSAWPDGVYAEGSSSAGGGWLVFKVASGVVVEGFHSEDIWWRNGGRGDEAGVDTVYTPGTWESYTMDGHTPGRTDELWGNYSGAVYGNTTSPLKSIQTGTITIGWTDGSTASAAEELPMGLYVTIENWETGSAVVVYEGIFRRHETVWPSGDITYQLDYKEWDIGANDYKADAPGSITPQYGTIHPINPIGYYVANWYVSVVTDDGSVGRYVCNKSGTNQGPAFSSWGYPFSPKYKIKILPGSDPRV